MSTNRSDLRVAVSFPNLFIEQRETAVELSLEGVGPHPWRQLVIEFDCPGLDGHGRIFEIEDELSDGASTGPLVLMLPPGSAGQHNLNLQISAQHRGSVHVGTGRLSPLGHHRLPILPYPADRDELTDELRRIGLGALAHHIEAQSRRVGMDDLLALHTGDSLQTVPLSWSIVRPAAAAVPDLQEAVRDSFPPPEGPPTLPPSASPSPSSGREHRPRPTSDVIDLLPSPPGSTATNPAATTARRPHIISLSPRPSPPAAPPPSPATVPVPTPSGPEVVPLFEAPAFPTADAQHPSPDVIPLIPLEYAEQPSDQTDQPQFPGHTPHRVRRKRSLAPVFFWLILVPALSIVSLWYFLNRSGPTPSESTSRTTDGSPALPATPSLGPTSSDVAVVDDLIARREFTAALKKIGELTAAHPGNATVDDMRQRLDRRQAAFRQEWDGINGLKAKLSQRFENIQNLLDEAETSEQPDVPLRVAVTDGTLADTLLASAGDSGRELREAAFSALPTPPTSEQSLQTWLESLRATVLANRLAQKNKELDSARLSLANAEKSRSLDAERARLDAEAKKAEAEAREKEEKIIEANRKTVEDLVKSYYAAPANAALLFDEKADYLNSGMLTRGQILENIQRYATVHRERNELIGNPTITRVAPNVYQVEATVIAKTSGPTLTQGIRLVDSFRFELRSGRFRITSLKNLRRDVLDESVSANGRPAPPTPAASSASSPEDDVRTLIERWIDASNLGSGIDQAALFSDRVRRYFDDYDVNRSFVRADIETYQQKWPDRREFRATSIHIESNGNLEWKVIADIGFTCARGTDVRHGKVRDHLIVAWEGGKPVIKSLWSERL